VRRRRRESTRESWGAVG